MIEKDKIIEVLKTVRDPEIFLDIWFLGLIYNINIDQTKVEIEMTFTSPLCPVGPQIVDEIVTKVKKLDGVQDVQVSVVFEPAWEPSDEVKAILGVG